MKVKAYPHFLSAMIIVSLLFLGACSDPKFGVVRGQKQTSAPNLQTSSFQQCSNFTLIRPQVDLLFVWDNSSSSIFVNNQTKQALNQVVENVSDRFDYHIVLAPLLTNGNPVNWNMKIVTRDETGLSQSALAMRIPQNQAASSLNFPLGSGSREAGLQRVNDIIRNNMNNGVFRNGAYTIIVLMSTENDDQYFAHYGISPDNGSDALARDYADIKINELICLRGNTNQNCSNQTSLNSPMMRFISIVPYASGNSCGIPNSKRGLSYLYASQRIYDAPYSSSIPSPNDQNDRVKEVNNFAFGNMGYDSLNICQRNYSGIFDSVNNVIQDTVVNHKYNRWPVAGPNASVDSSSLVVRKSNGQEYYPVGSGPVPAGASGYRYLGVKNNLPTRYEPSVGEPFTGHMIELFGDAQVTYPECLSVTSTTEREYYGYVLLGTSPVLESSIKLFINGSEVPKCASATTCTNGWVYDGYRTNQNVKVTSPTNLTPASPAELRTGYLIKLFGSAVYSNGDNINVNWLPAGGN